jgi:hypothetical protein
MYDLKRYNETVRTSFGVGSNVEIVLESEFESNFSELRLKLESPAGISEAYKWYGPCEVKQSQVDCCMWLVFNYITVTL